MAICLDRFYIADKPWRKATSQEHLALQIHHIKNHEKKKKNLKINIGEET